VNRVDWSERAVKQLDRTMARATVRFMNERVHGSDDPRLIGKPLRGAGLWRDRVGDYRVLCRIDDGVLTVLVVELGHRREVYR